MNKLKLDAADLQVESFEAVAAKPAHGTVRGHDDVTESNNFRPCTMCDCTMADSCGADCTFGTCAGMNTCGDTCDPAFGTCGDSCGSTCACPASDMGTICRTKYGPQFSTVDPEICSIC